MHQLCQKIGASGVAPGGGGGGAPCPLPGGGGGGAPAPPAPAPAHVPAPPGGGGGAAIMNAQLSRSLNLILCPNTALYASVLYKHPGRLYTILLMAGNK